MVNHLMKKQILMVAGMAALLCLTACNVKDPNQDIIQADKGQAEPNVLPVGIKKIASVAKKGDEIVIQGDFIDECILMIQAKYPQVN